MVKRKTTRKTARRAAAPARKIYRRRSKTGYDKIAPAMATAALVAVNVPKIKNIWDNATMYSMQPARVYNRIKNDSKTQNAILDLVRPGALVNDAAALAGGYIGGEIIRKYAPTVIKKPLAKISKKIPKVIE